MSATVEAVSAKGAVTVALCESGRIEALESLANRLDGAMLEPFECAVEILRGLRPMTNAEFSSPAWARAESSLNQRLQPS